MGTQKMGTSMLASSQELNLKIFKKQSQTAIRPR
jgi:hypothetical protein